MRCNPTIKWELGRDLLGSCQQQQIDRMNPNGLLTTGGCCRLALMNGIGELMNGIGEHLFHSFHR